MSEHNLKEKLKEETERLGWTVEYLKQHLAKEQRIKEVFERLKLDKNTEKGYEGEGGGF